MINGTYRILYIKWEDEFLPIGCLISNGFDENVQTISTTTRDNSGWGTSAPTNQSYSISFEGLIKQTILDGVSVNYITYENIKTLKRNRTLIDWKIESSVDIHVSSGKGYITSLNTSANIDEFVNFNGVIEGYGEPIESKKELTFLQSSLQIELN